MASPDHEGEAAIDTVLSVGPLLLGLALGWLRGGRPVNIVGSCAPAVLVAAVLLGPAVVGAAAERTSAFGDHPGRVCLLYCAAALIALLVTSRTRAVNHLLAAGVLAVVIGSLLNGLVLVANDEIMPWSPGAARVSNVSAADESHLLEGQGYAPIGPSTRLRILGDVIALPQTGKVISWGDVILIVGLVGVLSGAMAVPVRRAGATRPSWWQSMHLGTGATSPQDENT